MEYTPIVWHTGDVITEEKLNSMVSGITEGVSEILVATIIDNSDDQTVVFTLDKTFKEIKESKHTDFKFINGSGFSIFTTYNITILDGNYSVDITVGGEQGSLLFTTDNENGYPSYTTGK